ncbi:helix-turn-helix domain-containing protein [Streptomyces sp. NPDC087859]|uniref:transcriptional regulator n=1 Tax=Streptomyces sp. NPDC087859 TaxID=3365812 RepID=UPI0038300FC5
MAGNEFSELLGQLKDRSGLSYGVLGKRLHTSTSTLHRYVNGDAVPTDYAPVERFARVCGATSEELVELHRRWVLMDARRGQKAGAAPEATETPEATEAAGPPAEEEPQTRTAAAAGTPRRRTVVLAGAAVAAVLVSAALVANLVPGDGDDEQGGKQSAGAAVPSVDESPRASGPADAKGGAASPSGSPSGGPTASASASRSGGAGAARGDSGVEEKAEKATAPAVAVNPYKWETECGPHFLVDRKPEQVPPPPGEQDARGWVNALGAVSAGRQMLALTVQGTGRATVVLDDLHVRVVKKGAPLDWNDFSMGVGCGGDVDTTAFAVDLDAGRPVVSPKAGQRDFPYKVSESDPEVFYILADARAHDVRWYLELDWSSGDRKGTVRIDDQGRPFRTSGNAGRPAYDYPLGASEWGRNEYEPDIPG